MNNAEQVLNRYFNTILKASLKYPETFTINVDLHNKLITLISDIDSGLIQSLRNNPKLKSVIERTLLEGFSKINRDIQSLELLINNDRSIIISYGRGFSVADMNIYANVASTLNLKELGDFCTVNTEFSKNCKDKLFWLLLFNNRFGTPIENEVFMHGRSMLGKINNYEEIYKEMLSYLEGKLFRLISLDAQINLISGKLIRENNVKALGNLLKMAAEDNDTGLIKVILDNYTMDYIHLYDSLVYSIANDDKIINHINSESVVLQYAKGRRGARVLQSEIKEPKEINLEQIKLILNHEASYSYKLGGEYYERRQYITKKHLFIMLEILDDYDYKLPDEVMKLFEEHMTDTTKQPFRGRRV